MVMKTNSVALGCMRSVDALWQGAVRAHKAKPCIGVQTDKDQFDFITFKEMNYHAKCCCSTLTHLANGMRLEVGIWGAKCPAWMVSILACAKSGIAYAPISHNLPSYAVDKVVAQSGMFLMFASESDLVQVAKTLQRTSHSIQYVVYWGRDLPHYAEEMEELRKAKVTAYNYCEFLEMGHVFKDMVDKDVDPDADLAVVYRMGEKGKIYGERYKNRVLVDKVISFGDNLKGARQEITCEDVALSCLPLDEASHIIAELFLIYRGVRIGYNSSKSNSLIFDAQCLKPTLVFSSSTELADISRRLNETTDQRPRLLRGLSRPLFWWGCRRKLTFMKHGIDRADATPLFDALVFQKVGRLLGGRQRIIAAIGAVLEPKSIELLQISMCCTVHQIPNNLSLNSMAEPNTIHSVDMHQELSSFAQVSRSFTKRGADADHREDSLKNGSHVSSPNSVQASWSDVDSLSEKEIVGDATGFHENADSSKQAMCQYVEGVYKNSRYVRSISVYHQDENQSLAALIIPDNRRLTRLATLKKIDPHSKENAEITAAILEDLRQMGKEAGLRNFEMIKSVSIKKPETRDSPMRALSRAVSSFRIPSWLPARMDE